MREVKEGYVDMAFDDGMRFDSGKDYGCYFEIGSTPRYEESDKVNETPHEVSK